MMEIVDHGGWPNCIRLGNDQIELVATTDVGPRIIRLGFIGGQNLLKEYPETLGRTGDPDWHPYGGHRLWHAPEAYPRSYSPDNGSVEHEWDSTTLTLRSLDKPNGIGKEIRLTVSPTAPRVHVVHRLINRSPWPIELAIWALTAMAPGGRAIFPMEDFANHPDVLVPARPLVLWHFTDMSDPRWTWGRSYVQFRHDPITTTKQKVGMLNRKGWAAYLVNGDALIKRYPYEPGASYADMGCNTESYADKDTVELETLGPLVRLEPGAHAEHIESWRLAKVNCGPSDRDIDESFLPLVAEEPFVDPTLPS